MLKEQIENKYRLGVPMGAAISMTVFISNIVDDVAVFFYRGMSVYYHWDVFDLSVLVGKVLNICY